ncbi:MAG TPA: hypothetical protein VF085_01215 [Solirubrobacterales bacterium]
MTVRETAGRKVEAAGEKIAGTAPPLPAKAAKAPWWVVLLTFIGAAALIWVGVLVLREGHDMWVNPDPPEVSSAPTKVTSKVVKKPAQKGGNRKRKKPRSQIVARSTTKEWASQDGGRSEALALATLATGAALLLAGGFAARLTSIKLPGGVELVAAAAYNAGVEAGTVSTAQAAKVAKEGGKEDVLGDEKKLAEAGRKTLRIHFGSEAVTVADAIEATAPGGGRLHPLEGEGLQQAAVAAVDDVAE